MFLFLWAVTFVLKLISKIIQVRIYALNLTSIAWRREALSRQCGTLLSPCIYVYTHKQVAYYFFFALPSFNIGHQLEIGLHVLSKIHLLKCM